MSLSLSRKAREVKPSSTLAISARAKEMKAQGIDVVGFGAGEPDFDTPENIKQAGIRAIQQGMTKYTPASGLPALKEAVSKKFASFNHLNYAQDQIVISNGGKHALTNIFTAILNPGDEVIIPAPYWLSYPEIVKLAGGVPVFIRGAKANGYKVTAEQIRAAVTDKTKALVLNSPNNPTGMIYHRTELMAIADVAVECDFYVVSDEMYEQLIYGDGSEHVSIASLGGEIYDRTITCSGLSKTYAMTGWRIGYTGSSRELAKIMGSVQSHQTSNPNSIAQMAAIEALNGPTDEIERMTEEFARRRDVMIACLSKVPYLDFEQPLGAFYIFVDVSAILPLYYKGVQVESAERLSTILLEEYRVAVVPCADFGFPDHIRLSYSISVEMIEKGIGRIAAFVNELEAEV